MFIAAHMINLNEKAKTNIKRAKAGKRVHQTSKSCHAVRDAAVRSAMNVMKSKFPWSVQRFLTELSEPAYNDALFEMMDLGNLKINKINRARFTRSLNGKIGHFLMCSLSFNGGDCKSNFY